MANKLTITRRLPYIVLEFDNNQVLVDAMDGDLANPVWNYRADL